MGQSVGINCEEAGLFPLPRGIYRCGESLTWEPPLPADLRCSDGTVDYSLKKKQKTGNYVTEKLQIMQKEKIHCASFVNVEYMCVK